MNAHRPTGITIVCVLVVIGALIDLVTALPDLGDFEEAQWAEKYPVQAQMQQFYHYLHAGVALLSCYFMMRAHNWARWLYLIWNTTRVVIAFALPTMPNLQQHIGFLAFRDLMIPGMIFFVVALWLLCRAEARAYFAHEREPSWEE
jgi:hypothetical protein